MGSSNEMEQVDHIDDISKKVDPIDRQAAIDALENTKEVAR